jgi:hypothetical protein
MDKESTHRLMLRARLSHAVADLEEALTLLDNDATEAAAIASAVAFVEMARARLTDGNRPTEALPRPTINVVPPPRQT